MFRSLVVFIKQLTEILNNAAAAANEMTAAAQRLNALLCRSRQSVCLRCGEVRVNHGPGYHIVRKGCFPCGACDWMRARTHYCGGVQCGSR